MKAEEDARSHRPIPCNFVSAPTLLRVPDGGLNPVRATVRNHASKPLMVQASSRIRCRQGELQIQIEQNGIDGNPQSRRTVVAAETTELQSKSFKEKQLETQTITVAKFIDQQITQGEKLQEDIAIECGFANSNIISMIKNGVTKLPLAKVGVMARALDVDPAYMLRLTMSEYMPEVWSVLEEIFGRASFVTVGELDLLAKLRQRAHGLPIGVAILDHRSTLEDAVGSVIAWHLGSPAEASVCR